MSPHTHGRTAPRSVLSFLLLISSTVAVEMGLAGAVVAQEADDGATEAYDEALFEGMEYRMIGPSRGGRVTAVAGVVQDEDTFFMGSTGGGVWRTSDAGESWENVTDGQIGAGSIGAVAVAPSDPNVIYVGTGSACPRGNVSIGKGMYRSTDRGETWTAIGLEEAGLIGRVEIDPDDPELLYAAVLGNPFGPSSERGVYRSRDGGERWERILHVSDSTGAVDLAMNSANPREIYAAMWRVERKPWTLIDGAEEGGLYKTTDEGESWERLEGGLPRGPVGRIGVTVSPADPERVWALVTAPGEEGGVYRSDDRGRTWEQVNREHRLRQRGWYYSHIHADPRDRNTVYVLNTGFYRSHDGGRSYERLSVPHGDVHDLWIHPADPELMVVGNDGGAQVSRNGAETWTTMHNQPTAEFYRVEVDHAFPYRVYGAQQDNSTISVPSRATGSLTPDWEAVGGGESGHIAVHPEDPAIVYAGTYSGELTRLDRRRDHRRQVTAYPHFTEGTEMRELAYRFQWNAPIEISPHDPEVVYHTAQYVLRTRNGGQSWERVSPDLTRGSDHGIPGGPIQYDATGVEVYNSIFAFQESPHRPGVLWAGTDDGLVHLSRDGGGSWTEVTPVGMPDGGTVNAIEISPHDPDRVYLVVYKYRENDFAPYVFRTHDGGESWTRLTDGGNGIPEDHFVRALREDPVRPGLLYAGTEFGLYVSFDDGGRWHPLQLDLPVTPITDLAVHEGDLVVSTQGRSFWILDDLAPLREFGEEVVVAGLHLFEPEAAYRTRMPGDHALISYFVGSDLAGEIAPDAPLALELVDEEGTVLRRFSSAAERSEGEERLPASAGVHRVRWDLRYPGPFLVEDLVTMVIGNPADGPVAPPGPYEVRLSLGDRSVRHTLEVAADPRWEVSDDELRSLFELTVEVREMIDASQRAVADLRRIREQVEELGRRSREVDSPIGGELRAESREIARTVTELEHRFMNPEIESRQDAIGMRREFINRIGRLYAVLLREDHRPTRGIEERLDDLSAEHEELMEAYGRMVEEDLPALNARAREAGLSHVAAGGS